MRVEIQRILFSLARQREYPVMEPLMSRRKSRQGYLVVEPFTSPPVKDHMWSYDFVQIQAP